MKEEFILAYSLENTIHYVGERITHGGRSRRFDDHTAFADRSRSLTGGRVML